MRRQVVAILLGLVIAAIAFADYAVAQQPAPAVLVEALNLKIGQLQQNLDQVYLGLAAQKKALAAADDRLKWVLDNWVPKVKD